MKQYHLLITIKKKLSRDRIKSILTELVELLEMKALSKPLLFRGTTNEGWTGIIIIEESHIAIHSFEEYNKTWVDILSCRKFSKEKIKEFLTEF